MFERLKSGIRSMVTKESRSWPAILSLGYSGPQWMADNYLSFAKEGYIWNSDVYACINAGVKAFRGLDWGVYVHAGEGRERIEDGPLYDLLRQPNGRQSFSSLAGEWFGCMEISGNAYVEGVSVGNPGDVLKRPPSELFVLRPDRMRVVVGDAKVPIAGYQYQGGGVIVDYPAQMWRDPRLGSLRPRVPVMHSKYWHPVDDFYGLSPLRAAARNIDASNSAVSWNVGITQNAMRPSGVFSTPDTSLTAQQAEEYSNIIRQKFSGPANAGKPLVLGKGLTWSQLGLSAVDMAWLEGLEWNTTKICSVFGVPPEMIGDSAHRTYSNFMEARKSAYLENWLPKADMLCEDLNVWLAPLFWEAYGAEVFISYDKDAIEAIQEDRQLKWQNAKSGTGFLTVNEQRELLGYKPVPEGDIILVPVGSIPLEMAGAVQQHTIDTPPPQPIAPGVPPAKNPSAANTKPQPPKKPAKRPDPKGNRKKSVELLTSLPAPQTDDLLRQVAQARERIKALIEQ